MHNNNKIIAIILVITGSINAYELSFYNNTREPMAVAIQFADGEREPLYKQLIKSNSMGSFTPGKLDIPDIKWSFCLKNIYYAKNPTIEQRAKYFEKTIWKKVPITWTPLVLESSKKPKRIPKTKKQAMQPTQRLVKKAVIKPEDKSLCRDRHFEITENEHGQVVVMGSLNEPL